MDILKNFFSFILIYIIESYQKKAKPPEVGIRGAKSFFGENAVFEKQLGAGNFGLVTLVSYTFTDLDGNVTKQLYAKKEFKIKEGKEGGNKPSEEKIKIEEKAFMDEMKITTYISNLTYNQTHMDGAKNVVMIVGFDYKTNQIYLENCPNSSLDNYLITKEVIQN